MKFMPPYRVETKLTDGSTINATCSTFEDYNQLVDALRCSKLVVEIAVYDKHEYGVRGSMSDAEIRRRMLAEKPLYTYEDLRYGMRIFRADDPDNDVFLQGDDYTRTIHAVEAIEEKIYPDWLHSTAEEAVSNYLSNYLEG